MSTYTQIIYQIVFGTKFRRATINAAHKIELYKFIAGILKKKNCHLYIINGVEDHLHIVTHLHPSVSLADLIKDIKVASSVFIKQSGLFPTFIGWQNGYGAFTYTKNEKDRLIRYVRNQEVHHHGKSFEKEYMEILAEHGIQYDEKYLF